MSQTLAVEMAPFTLADGVTVDALLSASQRLERDFLSKIDGYVGRLLVCKDEKSWADIVFWNSAEQAAKAMEQVASSEVCGGYFACMAAVSHDDPDHGVTLFRSVERYGAIPI